MDIEKSQGESDFDYVYTHYFTPLFRYIFYQTKNREVAEDLVQTVFLKALRQKDTNNFPPLPYFFTIARNTVIDYWKKKKEITIDLSSVLFSSLLDEHDNPQEKLEKEFDAKEITQALETLNYEQKEILTLRFISDLSNKEISAMLGKTEEAVRQIQYRAIKKLRDTIL
ncbi:MAG: RNA polymerase, sigma-24 subunit, ECF subfamily [Candidatus Moranbacteria bacterium GW2011_GWF2_36_839]|nr:MAG: RNA polymerase, sigma-24 subunit, ECF subfamily [Candidatus Moranbacteria bacterium GW2011_GWF1_36_78]KKQ16467.1 MAG: RNA polymerase, sigma-24 subunit, ECF subfamily [Candidatus Moranbacteria bacterium GW2011_GWF2_36_839]